MNIGTPGQLVKVAIDTGSSELWVNLNCQTAGTDEQVAACQSEGKYDPSASSTSRISETTNEIAYGKGQVVVQYAADHINLPQSRKPDHPCSFPPTRAPC